MRQVRELPQRFLGLPAMVRWALGGGAALLATIFGVMAMLGTGAAYQYAFTNLTTEDGAEAAAALKAAGIPFRAEAGGSALAVPASKVHDARLLLAAAGLPRGGGVGFEIFDRGDLGVSEFTQRVNLRRAIEGELSRTISRLAAVRSARVHLTLPEKGLYRDENRKATAAVVLNLQPGRSVGERELAGVRHLVSAAVTGLDPDAVTVVDGRGTVLAGDRSAATKLATEQRELEAQLERRIVELLEPAVGQGAVVAKVTATLDSAEVETTADAFDPDQAVVRSERKVTELTTSEAGAGAGVAGAAANQPLGPSAGGGARGDRAQTSREEDLKNYEINKTVTRTVSRTPRLVRLSAAVLVDGAEGKPRAEAEMRRLAELAKHAMGFDAARGDRFDISSAPFAPTKEPVETPIPFWARRELSHLGSVGLGALALAVVAALLLRGRRGGGGAALLRPGAKVSELEAAFHTAELSEAAGGRARALGEGSAALRDRARELTQADPTKAAHLLRAWINADAETREGGRG